MKKGIEALRAEYRKLREKSALSLNKFDLEAEHLAHEIADGEETTPEMWVTAARMVLSEEVA